MITVAHIITGLNVGGAETMLCKLVAGSDRSRFRHVVISLLEPGPVGIEIDALGIPVHSLHLTNGIPDPRGVLRLRSLLRSVEPDVLQTWLYHANLLGLLGGMLTGRPVIWNIRSSFHRELGTTVEALARLCALLSRLPVAVVTNSDVARARHTALGYRPREWAVIPNGFDVTRFAPNDGARRSVRDELGLPPDALLIGLVGRFHPMKGHRVFLEAARITSEDWPECHFVLVGRDVSTENAKLREAIKGTALGSKCHLLGERHDLPRLTAALDVATNCSLYGESFSNAVGEAMSCAVPCVVTDVGDSARIVGETGMVVAAGDASALAIAWSELLKIGADGRAALGKSARARIEALYSLDRVVQQYEVLYESVVEKRRR
jgi:glycosyltransferase involved in cell wall biosynthesis